MFLTSTHLNPIVDRAHKTLARPQRDFMKQDALCVGVDENAATVSTPRAATQSFADACIREARRFKAGLDLMSGDAKALDEWR